jgi:hypothetical protein
MTEDQLDPTFAALAFSAIALSALVLLYAVPHTAGVWRLFKRAKKPGWMALVPLLNTYIQGQISKKSGLAAGVNGLFVLLVIFVVVAVVTPVESQALFIVGSLVVVVLLFMGYEELDKHFLKHFGLSKHSLEGSATTMFRASKSKSKK